MALFNKVGSTLKQNISQSSTLSLLNTARCMSTKLFVGGLSYGTDDNLLREAFSQYGEVSDARIVTHIETGRSRGFGFVIFSDSESADSAVSAMDGEELHGRNIRVKLDDGRSSFAPGSRGRGNDRSGGLFYGTGCGRKQRE